jgi:hypothetical protein
MVVLFSERRIVTLENVKMKKAILEKGSWRKIGKPKIVSQASPSEPLTEEPAVQEPATTRAIRVTRPQQGVGVPPVGRVMEGQKAGPAFSSIGSEPKNLRQTERIDDVKTMQTNTVMKPQVGSDNYSNVSPSAIEEVGVAEKAANKTRQSRRSEKVRSEPSRRRTRDLQSGMELLNVDFLLGIVENTSSNDDMDVTMRKLNFNELIRTEQLHAVDSNALKVYALNEDGFYDKQIQFEAVKELSARTTSK